MEKKMDIGMVGMAVMGSNLALNMADHGFDVACYNYTPDLTEKVLREHPHKHMHGFFNLQEFVDSLQKPRRIMLLIMAGEPVDSMIEQLTPLLEPGDIILDGGILTLGIPGGDKQSSNRPVSIISGWEFPAGKMALARGRASCQGEIRKLMNLYGRSMRL